MTATEPNTATAKWTADSTLGPRQAKLFNKALSDFSWKAKEEGEIGDYSEGKPSYHVAMMGPWVNPKASELMEAVRAKYNLTVTAKNYQAIIADLQAGIAVMHECRPVKDRRRTPEEKAELEQARLEREAKANAEAARVATMVQHTYTRAETAAVIKRVLGTLWPDVKFSVTSEHFSGGGAIRASWVDGPTQRQVHNVMGVFQDTHFDGMTDSESHSGPEGWNGHRFDFHTGYCSQARNHSVAFLESVCSRFSGETGLETPEIAHHGNTDNAYIERGTAGPCGFSFHPHYTDNPNGTLSSDEASHFTASEIIHQMAYATAGGAPAFPIGDDRELGPEKAYDITRETVFRIILGELKATERGVCKHCGNFGPVGTQCPACEPRDGLGPMVFQPFPSFMREPFPSPESGQTAGGVTMSQNEEKDGVEIRFSEKPDSATLDRLKAAGWRWSKFSKVWYHKRTPAALMFARQIVGAEEAGNGN